MEVKVEQTNILLKQYSERQEIQPLNIEEQKAVGEITDIFLERIAESGLLILYAYSIAYTKKQPFDLKDFSIHLGFANDDYASGILTATSAAGFISYNISKDILNIIDMNEPFRLGILPSLDRQLIDLMQKILEKLNLQRKQSGYQTSKIKLSGILMSTMIPSPPNNSFNRSAS
jgi:hypothetical protein